jgi:phosphoglycolate phosphatase
VTTAGAGQRALERAFQELFGVRGALASVEIAGRTDPLIVRDALERHGLVPDTAQLDALRDAYFGCLADELERSRATRVLPGVCTLLARLSARPDIVLALLTGNYGPSARLKLEHAALWRYFPFGAFGDDAADRNGLVPVALARARARGHDRVDSSRTVVIGDTRHDVACARAGGAGCVAVATGKTPAPHLQEAGADHVFTDLSDTDAVEQAIDALAPPDATA